MNLFKKNATLVQEVAEIKVIPSTVEIARNNLVNEIPIVAVSDHIRNLAQYNSEARALVESGETAKCLIEKRQFFIDNGFNYIVLPKIISSFKYHAGIKQGIQINRDDHTRVSYVGDIPEFAIERLNKFDKLWRARLMCSEYLLTIHSNQEMPIKIMPIDPILIGWVKARSCFYNERLYDIQNTKDVLGVVIGVWDNDKELEL